MSQQLLGRGARGLHALPASASTAPAAPIGCSSQPMGAAEPGDCGSRSTRSPLLSAQGSPFSDPGFSALGLRWAGVPVATLPFLAWRTMGDVERLARNYGAYATFDAFLQLVWDDQDELCPNCSELLAMLGTARAQTRGLLANLTYIMAAMGIPTPPAPDPLTSEAASVGAFEKKCRGYVVCREYHGWVDRTVRDFTLLKAKYPA
uniref:Uncharacterized protein n=1 Tax=Gopherus evgoodei TaxID=1825980 RepID=A0A8C4WHW3_9SAUR